MTTRPASVYETGFFSVSLPGMEPTVGWAEVAVDVLDQPTMRMHLLVPEGFMSEAFHWNGDFGLRVSRADGPRVELLVAEDGYGYRLEVADAVDDVSDDLHDELVELGRENDSMDVLRLLTLAAASIAKFAPVTDDLLGRLRGATVDGPSLDEVLAARGREVVPSEAGPNSTRA